MGIGRKGASQRLHLSEPAIVRGLSGRFRLIRLLRRFPERLVWAAFVLIMGFVSIAILATVAMLSRTPFLFPSLGPTAILFFFHPMSPSASPRHALFGHAIGIVCGYGSLLLLGLQRAGPDMSGAIGLRRLFAVALSLSATAFFMILFKAAHAPAGATTLLISLGLITEPFHLLILEIAVALLCLQAISINRLAGLNYPIWARRIDSSMEELTVAPKNGPGLREPKETLTPKQ